jgi:hypothetical protein
MSAAKLKACQTENESKLIASFAGGIVEESISKQYGFNIWSISQATSEHASK